METVLGNVVLNLVAVVLNSLAAAVVLKPPVLDAAPMEVVALEVPAVRAPPTTVQHHEDLHKAIYSKNEFALFLDEQGAVAQ